MGLLIMGPQLGLLAPKFQRLVRIRTSVFRPALYRRPLTHRRFLTQETEPGSEPAENLPAVSELEPAEPRFEHYFDTQKVYSDLKYAGFSDGQADVFMITLRDMLNQKLASVKERAFPRWLAENEAYLFEAACSELRNEIQTARQSQAEEFRANLARMQRGVEIHGQELNEAMSLLKNDLAMEINERKDSRKADESAIDLSIQELNNKITVDLISDVKSEIEGLRWQTTRRGLVAVLCVAAAILLATSVANSFKKEKKTHRVQGPAEEYHVPMLGHYDSEVDVEDRRVESL